MAMMGHRINVEKSVATYNEPIVSSNSEKYMSSVLTMIEYMLNAEKPDATPEVKNEHQIMRNMFEICKIMKDCCLEHDDEE